MGKVTAYLRELKAKTGYTQARISELSGVPDGTVAKYLAGIEDESATYDILRKLVMCMGGSLDTLAGIQVQSVARLDLGGTEVIKQSFDLAIRHIDASHENAYNKLHEESVNVVRDKNKWLHRMFVYCCTVTVAFAIVTIVMGVTR